MMGIKNISTASSNSSSQMMQTLVNYQLKENVGEFMRAEDLLNTQYKTEDDSGIDTNLGLQMTDIIEFKTDSFNHWGIYIGCDLVAHLTDGYIRQALLADVANGKKCRVNNKVQSAEHRGLKSRHQKEVYRSVMRDLDSPVKQGAIKFNSEHQVTLWKYGKEFSDTVDTIVEDGGRVIGAAIGGGVGLATAGVMGAVEGAIAGYDAGDTVADYVAKAVQN